MPIRGIIAILLIVAVVATGCRNEDNTIPEVETQDRIIATASTTDDPSEILVTWFPAPCETFDQVLVELDSRFARLTVRAMVDVNTCPTNTISETIVDLGEPLGERLIFDEAFGDTVALNAEAANPGN